MTCNLSTYTQPECDGTRTWPPSLCSYPAWCIILPFYVSSNWHRAVCITSLCWIGAFKKQQSSSEETERNRIENTRSKFSSTTELEHSWKGSTSLSLAEGNAFSHSANKHPLWWQKHYRSTMRWGILVRKQLWEHGGLLTSPHSSSTTIWPPPCDSVSKFVEWSIWTLSALSTCVPGILALWEMYIESRSVVKY